MTLESQLETWISFALFPDLPENLKCCWLWIQSYIGSKNGSWKTNLLRLRFKLGTADYITAQTKGRRLGESQSEKARVLLAANQKQRLVKAVFDRKQTTLDPRIVSLGLKTGLWAGPSLDSALLIDAPGEDLERS